jgi:ATP-dependent Clp protease ATP-binding subunit ClpB
MNFEKFTIKSQEALQKSAEIASGNQQQAIEPGHLLKAILETDENVVTYLTKKLNVNEKILTANSRKSSVRTPRYRVSKRIYHPLRIQYFKILKKN